MSLVYDCAVIGGGLAGLSLASLLADKGFSVILFEKDAYPRHRVCGEYISKESQPFLERMGLDFSSGYFPMISELLVSAPKGRLLKAKLDLGGIGISRYYIDNFLAWKATAAGVTIVYEKVLDVEENGSGNYTISTINGIYEARFAAGSFGKRSNLCVKLQRDYIVSSVREDNYVGVKYHIKIDLPKNEIALHNFANGYCGISAVEDGIYCLCYLTHAVNLKKCAGNIAQMEALILQKNPFLNHIFNSAEFLWDKPLCISQVSFAAKTTQESGIFMVGDAAGMITPLCGNGMSMAMRSAVLLEGLMTALLEGKYSKAEVLNQYDKKWKAAFGKQLSWGRRIQKHFGNPVLSEVLIGMARTFPFIPQFLIKQTHGSIY